MTEKTKISTTKSGPFAFLASSSSSSGISLFGSAEKTSIILEIGNAFIKCGFGGESSPIDVIPTQFRTQSGKLLKIEASIEEDSIYSEKEWKEAIHLVMDRIFYRYVATNPFNRRTVLVLNLSVSSFFKKYLAYELLEEYKVASVCFLPSELMCMVPISRHPTALVIDCGYFETRILPVYNGIPVMNAFRSIPRAHQFLVEQLNRTLQDFAVIERTFDHYQKPIAFPLSQKVVEDILMRMCYIDKNPAKHQIQSANPWPSRDGKVSPPYPQDHSAFLVPSNETRNIFPLNEGEHLLIPEYIQYRCGDMLFEKDEEGCSITTEIFESLKKCSSDSRCELAQNILIVGGTSMLPGFKTRLLQEIIANMDDAKYLELKDLKEEIHLMRVPFPANQISWIGGSILSCLESYTVHNITSEKAQQHGYSIHLFEC